MAGELCIKALRGQSLFDIAVQQYGTAAAAIALASANSYSSLNPVINEGDTVILPDIAGRSQVLKLLLGRKIQTKEDIDCVGIGCWRIGEDFVVS